MFNEDDLMDSAAPEETPESATVDSPEETNAPAGAPVPEGTTSPQDSPVKPAPSEKG